MVVLLAVLEFTSDENSRVVCTTSSSLLCIAMRIMSPLPWNKHLSIAAQNAIVLNARKPGRYRTYETSQNLLFKCGV